jgi:hypothetical protein
VFLLSGNENTVQSNQFWGNDRYGLWLGSGYGLILGPTGPVTTGEPAVPPWTSSGLYIANNFFNSPAGDSPNGIDIAWDGLGEGTCFEQNYRAPGQPATTDAAFLPACKVPVNNQPMPTTLGIPTVSNIVAQASLVMQDFDGDGTPEPICSYHPEPCEWGPGPAPENARNLPQGYQPPPATTPCGPSTCGGSEPTKPGKGPKPKKK